MVKFSKLEEAYESEKSLGNADDISDVSSILLLNDTRTHVRIPELHGEST